MDIRDFFNIKGLVQIVFKYSGESIASISSRSSRMMTMPGRILIYLTWKEFQGFGGVSTVSLSLFR